MCITEFNQELYAKRSREYYIEEGIAIGEARGISIGEERGKIVVLKDLVKDGILKIDQAAQKAGMTVEEFNKI